MCLGARLLQSCSLPLQPRGDIAVSAKRALPRACMCTRVSCELLHFRFNSFQVYRVRNPAPSPSPQRQRGESIVARDSSSSEPQPRTASRSHVVAYPLSRSLRSSLGVIAPFPRGSMHVSAPGKAPSRPLLCPPVPLGRLSTSEIKEFPYAESTYTGTSELDEVRGGGGVSSREPASVATRTRLESRRASCLYLHTAPPGTGPDRQTCFSRCGQFRCRLTDGSS